MFSSRLHYASKRIHRKLTELGKWANWGHVYGGIISRMKKWVKNGIP